MLVDLDQSAEARSAEAKFRRGVELLSGADSDRHLHEAVPLIDAAAESGCAAAMELTAVFEAMGVARPQSWDRAFDRLLAAAGQGSASAQNQLLLLADNARDPVVPDNAGQDFWSERRGAISLDRLVQSGSRTALSKAPPVRVIEGFATPPECRWLMERARSRLSRAKVIKPTGPQSIDPGRSNSGAEFLVLDMDVVLEVVRTRIAAAARVPVAVFEPTQILHYAVGQEFKLHHDFLDPSNPAYHDQLRSNGQRIATFLIYLNEAFEGGETDFPNIGVRYRGRTGDAIFWANLDMEGRPDPLTVHAGLPPTSGEKWILSQWIRDRAPARS